MTWFFTRRIKIMYDVSGEEECWWYFQDILVSYDCYIMSKNYPHWNYSKQCNDSNESFGILVILRLWMTYLITRHEKWRYIKDRKYIIIKISIFLNPRWMAPYMITYSGVERTLEKYSEKMNLKNIHATTTRDFLFTLLSGHLRSSWISNHSLCLKFKRTRNWPFSLLP